MPDSDVFCVNTAAIAAKPCTPHPLHTRLLLRMSKTHVASETQQLQESRSSRLQPLPVVPGAGGTKACQWRLYIIPGLPLCCSWQGTNAAPGILSCRLKAALIYAWLLRHSRGCPGQGTGRFSYLLAISHDFHPKPGQRNKDCCAYTWRIVRSQLHGRL